MFAKIGNYIDTSGGTRFNYMFKNNKQITSTPELDISNVKTASDSFEDYGCVMMFYGCTNLVTINFKTNPVPTYYENAFQYISSNIEKPLFVFFSDDSNFVREEFHLPNMIVVDWNKGEDSWQQAFLYVLCKMGYP